MSGWLKHFFARFEYFRFVTIPFLWSVSDEFKNPLPNCDCFLNAVKDITIFILVFIFVALNEIDAFHTRHIQFILQH